MKISHYLYYKTPVFFVVPVSILCCFFMLASTRERGQILFFLIYLSTVLFATSFLFIFGNLILKIPIITSHVLAMGTVSAIENLYRNPYYRFTYSYTINGKTFTNIEHLFSLSRSFERLILNGKGRFDVGQTIRIFVYSKNPRKSMIAF